MINLSILPLPKPYSYEKKYQCNSVYSFSFVWLCNDFFRYCSTAKNRALVRSGQRASAVVIRMISVYSNHSNGHDTMYKPVFEFTTTSSQKEHYIHHVSSRPPGWKVGDTATIIYDIKQPQNAILLSFWGIYGPAVIVFALAFAFLVAGGLSLFFYRRNLRRKTIV